MMWLVYLSRIQQALASSQLSVAKWNEIIPGHCVANNTTKIDDPNVCEVAKSSSFCRNTSEANGGACFWDPLKITRKDESGRFLITEADVQGPKVSGFTPNDLDMDTAEWSFWHFDELQSDDATFMIEGDYFHENDTRLDHLRKHDNDMLGYIGQGCNRRRQVSGVSNVEQVYTQYKVGTHVGPALQVFPEEAQCWQYGSAYMTQSLGYPVLLTTFCSQFVSFKSGISNTECQSNCDQKYDLIRLKQDCKYISATPFGGKAFSTIGFDIEDGAKCYEAVDVDKADRFVRTGRLAMVMDAQSAQACQASCQVSKDCAYFLYSLIPDRKSHKVRGCRHLTEVQLQSVKDTTDGYSIKSSTRVIGGPKYCGKWKSVVESKVADALGPVPCQKYIAEMLSQKKDVEQGTSSAFVIIATSAGSVIAILGAGGYALHKGRHGGINLGDVADMDADDMEYVDLGEEGGLMEDQDAEFMYGY